MHILNLESAYASHMVREWTWPNNRLEFAWYAENTFLTLNDNEIWHKAGEQTIEESWSEISAVLALHGIQATPLTENVSARWLPELEMP